MRSSCFNVTLTPRTLVYAPLKFLPPASLGLKPGVLKAASARKLCKRPGPGIPPGGPWNRNQPRSPSHDSHQTAAPGSGNANVAFLLHSRTVLFNARGNGKAFSIAPLPVVGAKRTGRGRGRVWRDTSVMESLSLSLSESVTNGLRARSWMLFVLSEQQLHRGWRGGDEW